MGTHGIRIAPASHALGGCKRPRAASASHPHCMLWEAARGLAWHRPRLVRIWRLQEASHGIRITPASCAYLEVSSLMSHVRIGNAALPCITHYHMLRASPPPSCSKEQLLRALPLPNAASDVGALVLAPRGREGCPQTPPQSPCGSFGAFRGAAAGPCGGGPSERPSACRGGGGILRVNLLAAITRDSCSSSRASCSSRASTGSGAAATTSCRTRGSSCSA